MANTKGKYLHTKSNGENNWVKSTENQIQMKYLENKEQNKIREK